jgi:hypothetical protein
VLLIRHNGIHESGAFTNPRFIEVVDKNPDECEWTEAS